MVTLDTIIFHIICYRYWTAGLILGLPPANERRRYFVTTSIIGWVCGYKPRIIPELYAVQSKALMTKSGLSSTHFSTNMNWYEKWWCPKRPKSTVFSNVVSKQLDILFRSQYFNSLKARYRHIGTDVMHAKMRVNASPSERNARHIGRRHFQMHFLEWKWYNSE